MNAIRLYSGVPLSPDYRDTISHPDGTINTQYSYFTDFFDNREVANVSWTKPHKNLKIHIKYDDMLKYNYMTYYNDSGKIYYAFILEKNYINANTTEVVIEIDYMQTYWFDYNLESSYIEREHQDRVDKSFNRVFNIKSENLDYGDSYEGAKNTSLFNSGIQWYVIITESPIFSDDASLGYWGNAPSTHYIYMVPHIAEGLFGVKYNVDGQTYDAITLMDFYIDGASNNATLAVYPIPFEPFEMNKSFNTSTAEYTISEMSNGHYNILEPDVSFIDKTLIAVDTHNFNYEPLKFYTQGADNPFNNELTVQPFNESSLISVNRESKLWTYPYRYIMLTDEQATPVVMRYENVEDKTRFGVEYVQELGMTGKYSVEVLDHNQSKYDKTLTNNQDRGMPLLTDAWKDYQRSGRASAISGLSVNAISSGAGAATAIALGLAMTNPITALGIGAIATGSLISTGGQVAGHLSKERDIKSIPDSFRHSGNNSLFELARYKNTDFGLLKTYSLKIKDDYEKQLFDYFNAYGYLSKEIKKPNLSSRYRFNYIKTIGARVVPKQDGDVNADATVQLSKIYDNGITLHHFRPDKLLLPFKDYHLENIETILLED